MKRKQMQLADSRLVLSSGAISCSPSHVISALGLLSLSIAICQPLSLASSIRHPMSSSATVSASDRACRTSTLI